LIRGSLHDTVIVKSGGRGVDQAFSLACGAAGVPLDYHPIEALAASSGGRVTTTYVTPCGRIHNVLMRVPAIRGARGVSAMAGELNGTEVHLKRRPLRTVADGADRCLLRRPLTTLAVVVALCIAAEGLLLRRIHAAFASPQPARGTPAASTPGDDMMRRLEQVERRLAEIDAKIAGRMPTP
jgi:hypothetical protein